jgi:hypothetical protein
LQEKAPNALKSLDAKLKSAPALGTFFAPPAQRAGRGGMDMTKKIEAEFSDSQRLETNNRAKKSMLR